MRVLLVEDEPLLAMMMEDMLAELGFDSVDTASDLAAAKRAAATGDYAFAILDLNLGGALSFEAAAVLRTRGIPFAFSTGYGASALDAGFETAPILPKPFQTVDLERVIARLQS